jgi:hypothetical protein
MSLRLLQLRSSDGVRMVAAADESGDAWRIDAVASTYELARAAIERDSTLEAEARQRASSERIDLDRALSEQRILAPIDHPDSAHLHLTGTGLTHLGSAEGRDKMHRAAAAGSATDSMRMFLMGVEGGKPRDGEVGVQPEWFYKGDGSSIVAPGAAIPSPDFALDGSEEPEIAGIYVIDDRGQPRRLGFCLANEFSDHVTERGNYLWLAHSKLRPAALGPELLTGKLPADVRGDFAHRARWPDAVGDAVPHRRSEHVALAEQSRASSFQVRTVPPARRRTRAFFSEQPRCRLPRVFRCAWAMCSRSRRSRFVCR